MALRHQITVKKILNAKNQPGGEKVFAKILISLPLVSLAEFSLLSWWLRCPLLFSLLLWRPFTRFWMEKKDDLDVDEAVAEDEAAVEVEAELGLGSKMAGKCWLLLKSITNDCWLVRRRRTNKVRKKESAWFFPLVVCSIVHVSDSSWFVCERWTKKKKKNAFIGSSSPERPFA